jgi:hypothetical protein
VAALVAAALAVVLGLRSHDWKEGVTELRGIRLKLGPEKTC